MNIVTHWLSRVLFVVWLCQTAVVVHAQANEHQGRLRTWDYIDSAGKRKIEASLLTTTNTRVVIEDHNGKLHYITYENLSDKDAAYVEERMKKIESVNAREAQAEEDQETSASYTPLLSIFLLLFIGVFFLVRTIRQRQSASSRIV
ncbi:MAG: hypothetical protein JJ975_01085 [Bacteroidia bacterium]|nr:hypothetical protein [Bacteroidia bacterium]